MNSKEPIKVLIVDDSAVVRSTLTRLLSSEPDINVVAGAKDPYEARELIIALRPQVILLDIEMPRMDGLTFLKKLHAHYPVPVIMVSGVGSSSSHAALTAIELGAVDFVAKPSGGGGTALRHLCEDLSEKIRAAVIASPALPYVPDSAAVAPISFRAAGLDPNRYVVAIGASTGGTEAIKKLLSAVPADFPPIAIVQHMPGGFTESFAERLDQCSTLTVKEAAGGELLLPGCAFVARGGAQMSVRRSGGGWSIVSGTDKLVNRHCPSVGVLFDAVAQHVGKRAVGILLTGMGADGAKGLLTMQNRGALTIAQDQGSCIVYGMPKEAVDMGAVQHSAPPAEIPGIVLQALRQRKANPKLVKRLSETQTRSAMS